MMKIAEFFGESLGFVMRIFDLISGRRKTWEEEIKDRK